MVTKLYRFHNMPPSCHFYKKVVLRWSEHGDVIETQTVEIVPPKVFSKLGPCVWYVKPCVFHYTIYDTNI